MNSAVAYPRGTGTRNTRILGILTIASMAFLALLGLVFSAEDRDQGSSVRIMYVHVPSIWVAYIAFGMTAACSAIYLSSRTRSLIWDRFAGEAGEI
ncbi:MAG: cytochrome c biogenesis protein CcsA, partial [Ilumatobacteraceae bacterium]|nr:cytochrome c biogenesis protein CcsA [Ilumatobacteraceae bacterium]